MGIQQKTGKWLRRGMLMATFGVAAFAGVRRAQSAVHEAERTAIVPAAGQVMQQPLFFWLAQPPSYQAWQHHQELQQKTPSAEDQKLLKDFLETINAKMTERAPTLFNQVSAVNHAVNRYLEYASDSAVHGQGEYWASTMESLKSRKGDCEDFAILKYYVLRAMGVPADRLYLTGIKDHMILVANTAPAGTMPIYFVLNNYKGEESARLDAADDYFKDKPIDVLYNEAGAWVPQSQISHGVMSAEAEEAKKLAWYVSLCLTLVVAGGAVGFAISSDKAFRRGAQEGFDEGIQEGFRQGIDSGFQQGVAQRDKDWQKHLAARGIRVTP